MLCFVTTDDFFHSALTFLWNTRFTVHYLSPVIMFMDIVKEELDQNNLFSFLHHFEHLMCFLLLLCNYFL